MDPELLPRLKEELLVCETLAAEEQESRLSALGRTAPELERELRSLLSQRPIPEPDDAGAGFGAMPPEGSEERNAALALRQIGPYHLTEVLGVGGMGIVYRAEQREPLRREVAVKLLRGGVDPGRVIARFAAERRAMALLDHPAIARILDAGLDVDGMPYIVTELVRGTPVSQHCRERQTPVPDILRLFIDVCRAVQHAHQKGIIHRDLKPSNLMVAEVDGVPRPKIIDFGIARILEEEGEHVATLTAEGQAIGTLGYMSPEQAAGRAQEIDTRTDVYSLGAVLYELLTGALPHAIEGASLERALAAVTREDPRPFRLDPRHGRTRDADLETIVMKALAREPAKRYESAGALADDLERYLGHEAILARPPSAVYELRKLVRRHRTAFTLGATAMIVVTCFGIAMAVLYAGQRRARTRAQVEVARTDAMNRFLLGMLSAARPGAQGRSVTVIEVLDRAVTTVDDGFAHEPDVQAAVVTTLGNTYSELGQHALADSLLRRGLDLERRMHGERHVEVARALRDLADNAREWRRTMMADSLARTALALSEEVAGPQSIEVESCLLLLANIQTKLGREAQAESLLTRYLELARSLHGSESPQVGRGLFEMAMAKSISDQNYGPYYAEAIRILTKTLGPYDSETLEARDNYTDDLLKRGMFDEAIANEREVLAMTERTHGADHPKVAGVMYRLSGALAGVGRLDEAEKYQREGLRIWRAALGDSHSLIPPACSRMAEIRLRRGDLAGAESWARRSLELSLVINPEGHPRSVGEMQQLADILCRRNRYEEAGRLYQHLLEIRRRFYGLDSPATGQAYAEYGIYLLEIGRVDSAQVYLDYGMAHNPTVARSPWFRSGLAICAAAKGPGPRGDSLLVEAARVIEGAPGMLPDDRRVALRRLIRFCDAHGRSRLADPFRASAGSG